MAIIDRVQDDSPLSQGDLLEDVLLYVSKLNDSSYVPANVKSKSCVVLSRPCVASHKEKIVVATIEKYTSTVPDSAKASFDHLKKFLESCRGGWGEPDLFYIGELDGKEGRFCAKLDSIHTIQVPDSGTDERNEFIKKHRFARLSDSFVKDLHLRFFQAFASLGFEDYEWYCDSDLRMLIQRGNHDIQLAETAVSQNKSNDLLKSFEGKMTSSETETAIRKLEKIKAVLQPYVRELNRRKPPEPLHSSSNDDQIQ